MGRRWVRKDEKESQYVLHWRMDVNIHTDRQTQANIYTISAGTELFYLQALDTTRLYCQTSNSSSRPARVHTNAGEKKVVENGSVHEKSASQQHQLTTIPPNGSLPREHNKQQTLAHSLLKNGQRMPGRQKKLVPVVMVEDTFSSCHKLATRLSFSNSDIPLMMLAAECNSSSSQSVRQPTGRH